MRDSMHILDVLQERGYTPQDDALPGEGWFDRPFSEGTVRLVLSRDDATLHMFGPHMVNQWSVQFSDGTPSPVILATLRAAEREARGAEGAPDVCGCCVDNECECNGANLRNEYA